MQKYHMFGREATWRHKPAVWELVYVEEVWLYVSQKKALVSLSL